MSNTAKTLSKMLQNGVRIRGHKAEYHVLSVSGDDTTIILNISQKNKGIEILSVNAHDVQVIK